MLLFVLVLCACAVCLCGVLVHVQLCVLVLGRELVLVLALTLAFARVFVHVLCVCLFKFSFLLAGDLLARQERVSAVGTSSLLSDLMRSLLLSSRDRHPRLSMKLAECLGILGAVDPVRLDANVHMPVSADSEGECARARVNRACVCSAHIVHSLYACVMNWLYACS